MTGHGSGEAGAAVKPVERVVLVGFSGVGKSTVGRLLADRLGWRLVDTDAAIARDYGRSIPDIFRDLGEATFRAAERRMLAESAAEANVVVACGGGAIVDPAVWSADLLGAPGTLVVALDAAPETSLERLVRQRAAEGDTVERPLLAGADPLGRIRSLKSARQHAYDAADISLIVDRLAPEEVAAEIAGLPGIGAGGDRPDVELRAPSGSSAITIRAGARHRLGAFVKERWPGARRAWVVSDDRVAELHGAEALTALRSAAISAELFVVPAGEESKSLRQVERLYDRLLGGGIERGDVVVALGGGVIGDLAGFVAATCLRGVGLVQVPTSLLAMVDSSVGGKTGINHRAGKNLIGAFYQPPVVVVDPDYLRTLPPRELACGWAEIAKHALIQPSTPGGERGDLTRFLERNTTRLRALAEPATTYLIRRNVALKARVVEADEREAGLRAYLNYGHTLGHAIEAAGYHLLHGEAVALGLRGAVRIGAAVGTCGGDAVARVDALLDAFGLPAAAPLDADEVVALLGSDKKRAAGKIRWVLPLAEGGVTIRDDVAPEQVRAALRSVISPISDP